MGPSGSEKTQLLHSDQKPAGTLHLNCLSYWTLWWITGTFWKSRRRQLKTEDIYDIIPEYAAEENAARLNNAISVNNRRKPGVTGIVEIVRAFFWQSVYLSVLFFLGESARLCQPIILGFFLEYLTHETAPDRQGYIYGSLLILTSATYVALNVHSFYMGEVYGMRLRSAYSTIVYEKIFKLWSHQHQKITTGNIINLLSADIELITDSFYELFTSFSSVFNTIVVIALLYHSLGWASLAGCGACLILPVGSMVFSKKFADMRITVGKATDRRVTFMNEIISAIRVVKMYCWEKPFHAIISEARREEMRRVLLSDIYKGIGAGCTYISALITTIAILLIYYASGYDVTVPKAFTTMLYCNMLQQVGFMKCPRIVRKVGQMLRCIERVEDFILLEETYSATNESKTTSGPPLSTATVDLVDVSAFWNVDKDNEAFCQLEHLTFSLQNASLTAVVGPVGAGKTSLIMLLMGDMPVKMGQMTVRGRISYCPQTPWVFHDTLQQNILFGEDMDWVRYQKVIDVCGLTEDINAMPDRDLTIIGERGLTLSGGQKARVSLARAVYRDADIYLLDDPLSAVDSKVCRHLFDRCIKKFLSSKLCILATHQIQILSEADQIIVLEQGETTFVGPFNEISNSQDKFLSHITTEDSEDETCLLMKTPESSPQITTKDENVEGTVSWKVFWEFTKAGGVVLFVASIFPIAATMGISSSAEWFLSKWTDLVDPNLNQTATDKEKTETMNTFLILTAASVLLSIVCRLPLWLFLNLAARNLHNKMFNKIIGAPTRFFDTNPTGVVLNKFSRDLGFVDSLLAESYMDFWTSWLLTMSVFCVICAVLPWMALAAVVWTLILYAFYSMCVKCFRDLKRLEASTRSPIYSHVSETLDGLQSIRILNQEKNFINKFNALQDGHTMCWFMFLTSVRWFALLVSAVLVVCVVIVTILSINLKGVVPAALLGLCLTRLFAILEPFEYSFRTAAAVGNYMTSVERILSYHNLEQESAPVCKYRPPDGWPVSGSIQFESLSLYYYKGAPAALQNITANVKSMAKIGIVGRTGSGKSSLLHSLMRLTEPRGNLYIDGVDVLKIGLHDLREKISVIPQDPVLFSGTVRQNLDPLGCSTDKELWDVLHKVRLTAKVSSMFGQLDAEVYEGGSNLSVGQRQLVCLARALLRDNKILVLDEATANIDKDTDRIIQVTIRLYFHQCTVLIIAHRLDTIMDCNKVMVLDQGRLAEYDSPFLLLQNPDSLFNKYVNNLGEESARSLFEIAEEAYVNRHNI